MLTRRMIHWTAILLSLMAIVAFALPPAAHAAQPVYVVRQGDTLGRIAARYGTTAWAIANANGIRNINYIWAGQRLVIPGSGGQGGGGSSSGGVHVVQRGETLASIAYRYGTSVSALAAANGIRNPNLIYVGQRLTITGRSGGGSSGGGGSGGGGKWIEIDLSSQRLYAHAGNSVVYSFIVSTGIPAYPTPTGTFRIYSKYLAIAMSGPGYYLPGVPHTMFFYRGYAIHGTYWHNNFGHPMSHGCINLTRSNAAALYAWAPNGTTVQIHW